MAHPALTFRVKVSLGIALTLLLLLYGVWIALDHFGVEPTDNRTLVAVTLLIGLVALLSLFWANHLARQLNQIAHAIRCITQGDLSYRMVVSRHDELAQTALAFNTMAEQLQTDLADRQRVENELRIGEERLKYALRATGEGVWDWNRETHLIRHNPRWGELLQIDDHDLEHDMSYFLSSLHPADREAVLRRIDEAMESSSGSYYSIHRMITGQGEQIWIEDRGQVVQRDEFGTVLRMVGSIRDITEQQRIEGQLRTERAYLLTMLNSSPVGIAIVVNRRFHFVNPRMTLMLGVHIDETTHEIFVSPQEQEQLFQKMQQEGIIKNHECQFYTRDHQIRDMLLNCYPIEYQEQMATLLWVIDITDMKSIQAELELARDEAEAATRAKSEFLANMSHEIRTPMNAILGMTHLVLETPLNTKQQNYITKVYQSAERLLKIINEILDFSKIEAGRLKIEAIPFQLDELLNDLANLVNLRADDKGLELIFDLPLDLPLALIGDPLRLHQVLLNLVNNALKFTEQGEIVVRVRALEENREGVLFQLSVQDSGIGIPLHQQQRLFNPFSQADGSTTRRYGGTGLGLAISKRIIDLMQGEMSLESQPDHGSTFSFQVRLPRQSEAPPPELFDARRLGVLDLLLIEPNPTARDQFATRLTEAGFRVTAVAHCDQAFILAAATPPPSWQVILLSCLNHPPLILNSFTDHLQELLSPAPVPALLLLAKSRCHLTSEIEAEAAAILNKPLLPQTLLLGVAAACGETVTLPQVTRTLHQAAESDRHRVNGAHILVVEDNEINQEIVATFLQQGGVTVTLASNGVEALAQLATANFDGVLMDCMMPVMDGYTAAQQIRQNPAYATLPVIAVTANALEQDRDRTLAAGMNDYIAKPIQIDELFATLARWVKPSQPPTTPPPPLPSAEIDAEEWPPLTGIDSAIGLSYTNGNRRLYRTMLIKFRDKFHLLPTLFAEAEAHPNSQSPLRLIHTFKGLAAQIGAKRLQQLAARLEEQLRLPVDEASIARLLAAVVAELKPVIDSIAKLQPDPMQQDSIAPPLNRAQLLEQLQQLRILLQDDDTAARDRLEGVAPLLQSDPLLQNTFRQLSEQVLAFEFEAALQRLDQLEQQLNPPIPPGEPNHG